MYICKKTLFIFLAIKIDIAIIYFLFIFHKVIYIPVSITSIIVIKNGNICLRRGPYCWYFHLTLKYFGWLYISENRSVCEEMHSENEFEAVLSNFCRYDYDANASETVQKIATDQKDYHKCSSCVVVCWIVKICQ